MAAGLIRLQSGVRSVATESIDAQIPRAASAPPLELASTARQAAVRSGIEALRGFGVSLLGELQDGLERDAFHYVYEPVTSVMSGAIEGYRALIRWRRRAESVTPDLFLPIAEASGLIVHIQRHLLEQVAGTLASLAPGTFIALPCSLAQCADAAAVSTLIARTAELGIDPAHIVIEINGSSALIDVNPGCDQIMHLRDCGFRIALDGCGGRWAFWLLSRLPIDLLTVDCGLIGATPEATERAAVILEGILQVAREFGHRVVAQGVDSPQRATLVRRLGCDLMLGAFVGPPLREPGLDSKQRSTD